MIRFQCPTCNKVLNAPDGGGGRKTTCPKCGQRLIVPPPAQPTNQTVMGRPLPSGATPPPASPARKPPDWLADVERAEKLDEPPPPRRAPDVSDSDGFVLLELVEDPLPEVPPQPPGDHVLVECPTCHSPVRVPFGLLGQNVVCPNCRTAFATLAPPPAAPAPAPVAPSVDAPSVLPVERGTDRGRGQPLWLVPVIVGGLALFLTVGLLALVVIVMAGGAGLSRPASNARCPVCGHEFHLHYHKYKPFNPESAECPNCGIELMEQNFVPDTPERQERREREAEEIRRQNEELWKKRAGDNPFKPRPGGAGD